MKKILIIGATSAIAQAVARLFSEAGDSLFLVARNTDKLAIVKADLKVRGAQTVHSENLDVLDFDRHKATITAAVEVLDGLDIVLIAHGTLPDQKKCEKSFELLRREFEINALSTISLLTHLANYFEQKGSGTIAVISSVAADRGRQSNYVYGCAKGAVTHFLQGLRNRLYRSGVKVITIQPGFVDTPMTSSFKKSVMWANVNKVAHDIDYAIKNSSDVVYTPRFWRVIMLIIKMIPEFIFKRLKL